MTPERLAGDRARQALCLPTRVSDAADTRSRADPARGARPAPYGLCIDQTTSSRSHGMNQQKSGNSQQSEKPQQSGKPQQSSAPRDTTRKEDSAPRATPDGEQADPAMQGEGNRTAARRYNEETTDFARSGRVEQAARDARPAGADEARDLQRAEAEGKSHAREEDPLLHRRADGKGDPSR
jgi:hypothetical protein